MRYFNWRQLHTIVNGNWERLEYLRTVGHQKLRDDAASGRDVNAMFEVACLALTGDHRISSDTDGWLQAAADREHAGAHCVIGYLCEFGVDRSIDKAKAIASYEKSALLENSAAQYRLAYHFLETGKSSGEYAGFSRWCQKAAAANDSDGQYLYGISLRDGIGCVRSYPEAANWLRKSAEGNNSDAMKDLAEMYRTGHGVEKSTSLAEHWLMRYESLTKTDIHDFNERKSELRSTTRSGGSQDASKSEEERLLSALKALILHEDSRARTLDYYSQKYPNFTRLEILQKIFADYERDRS